MSLTNVFVKLLCDDKQPNLMLDGADSFKMFTNNAWVNSRVNLSNLA